MIRQLARFGTVGAANTLLSAVLYGMLRTAGAPPLLAAPVSFAAGAVNGFVLNGWWTFEGRRSAPHRYLVVQLGALAATELLVGAGVPYLVVLATTAGCAFVACRRWAFAR